MSSRTLKAKVGVFMPCYNMGPYIDEALGSLRDQTFKDFYVIIADDASPSVETKEKLATIDQENCKIYYEEKNLGLVKIANKYMSRLDSEYIVLFNPDDKLHPDFLKEQVEYLDKHQDIQAVSTWVQEFGEGNRLLEYTDELCRLPHMLVENNFSGAALMRKTAWLAAGKHDTDKSLYPNLDYDLWLSMLQKGFKLGIIKKPLFYWRVLPSSLSHSMSAARMLTFRKALLKKYLPLYQEYSDYVLNHYLEEFRKFEDYYALNEEGHAWLDDQYKRLTSANTELLKEKTALVSRLEQSIEYPYARSILAKVWRRLRQHF